MDEDQSQYMRATQKTIFPPESGGEAQDGGLSLTERWAGLGAGQVGSQGRHEGHDARTHFLVLPVRHYTQPVHNTQVKSGIYFTNFGLVTTHRLQSGQVLYLFFP